MPNYGGGGYTRTSINAKDTQPVAITSIDVTARTATGYTRNQTQITIDTSHLVGAVQVTPVIGDQWMVEKDNGIYKLYRKMPFNTPELLNQATAGQVQLGSTTGPVELNGSQVNINAPAMQLGSTLYRDQAGILQSSVDQGTTWTNVADSGGGGSGTLVYGELPDGIIDGTNTVFTTVHSFQASTTCLYRNGLREVLSEGYVETTSTTLTVSSAPFVGDVMAVDYTIL